jgi:hypothetical protein
MFLRSRRSGTLGHQLSNARLQQTLLVRLLVTAGTVLWIGNRHVWPGLNFLITTNPGFTPQLGASAASSSRNNSSSAGAHSHAAITPTTVSQAALELQKLPKPDQRLEFPIWWHAPFISQSVELTGQLLGLCA